MEKNDEPFNMEDELLRGVKGIPSPDNVDAEQKQDTPDSTVLSKNKEKAIKQPVSDAKKELRRLPSRLDEKRYAKLSVIAISRKMRVSELIDEVLAQYVDNYKKIEF